MAQQRSAFWFALAACLCIASVAAFDDVQPTTYTQLAPTKGQWKIAVATTKGSPDAFTPQTCDKDTISAPCLQPLLTADKGDRVQVSLSLKDKVLKTVDNLQPKRVLVRACYARPSLVGRPWRAANNNIDKDKSCPIVIRSAEFNATSYTFTAPIGKNSTRGVWYASVLVQCENGTRMSFCQADNTVNATYWGTNTIKSTPPGMIVATSVMSAIGPLFLAAFFLRDTLIQRRKASNAAPVSS